MRKPEVVYVLLSTYNGAKYLEEQLESIRVQRGVHAVVKVIDNNSTDSTRTILEKYKMLGVVENINYLPLNSATRNYFELLNQAPENHYVSFCDQDDIWHPEKLQILIRAAAGNRPSLAFSARDYIDKDGKKFGTSPKLVKPTSWKNALVQNIAPGNTMLLNPQGVCLLRDIGSAEVAHYDSWIYLCLSIFGVVVYVPQPLVLYRIHDGNLVGLRSLRSVSRLFKTLNEYWFQLEQFVLCGKSMEKVGYFYEIEQFYKGSITKNRFKQFLYIIGSKLYRQNSLETVFLKLLLAAMLIMRNKA